MPYIKEEDRKKFQSGLSSLPSFNSKGELEYCIYYLMQKYMSTRDFRYSTLHDCVYASQHCADEFRRRNLDKREDEARSDNGDV